MRTWSRYPAGFKEQLLAKAFSPHAPSTVELARKAGIPHATLKTWIYMTKNKHKVRSETPKDKGTAEAKLLAMFDTFHMTEAERGAYCRKHGLYTQHLEEWKQQVLAGLDNKSSNIDKEQRTENRHLLSENKQLKQELHRKEKALVEASALLFLKKKANCIWGDGEDD